MRSAALFAVFALAGCPAPSMQLGDRLAPRDDPGSVRVACDRAVPRVGPGLITISNDQVGLEQKLAVRVVDVDELTRIESAEVAQDGIEVPFATPPVAPAPAVVVARAVAGEQPVFGAPVAWSVDNGAAIQGQGDALVIPTFANAGAPNGSQAPVATPNVTATLGTSTTTAPPGPAAAGATFESVDAAGPFVPLTP